MKDRQITAVGADIPATAETETHDLSGYLLLPAPAEPHAHLDKALLAERYPNPTGDIQGALSAIRAAFPSMTEEDIEQRAVASLAMALRHGYTAIRTHVNCEQGIGTRSLRVLCRLREEYSDAVDLQVVVMAGMPLTGIEGASHRVLLEKAIEVGVDGIGGAPELDPRPSECVRRLVATAAAAGLPLDLHLDETTDIEKLALVDFVDEVARRGLAGRATASHCVSLGQQDISRARDVARALAQSGVSVVTLPQTNLWLQGRGKATRLPRGLTAVGLLREAGVVVAAGGDNCRDPFNPLGRIDPIDTAALLVAAAQLSPEEAYDSVAKHARSVMGLPPITLEAGSAADFLAVRATDISEAIASGTPDRWVFHTGRLVARTRLVTDVDPVATLRRPLVEPPRCRATYPDN